MAPAKSMISIFFMLQLTISYKDNFLISQTVTTYVSREPALKNFAH